MNARLLCLIALFLGGLFLTPVSASAQRLRIRLNTIHCNDAQEEGWLSDGDEPYIICARITNGGLFGRTLTFSRTQIYHNFDDGDERTPNLDLFNAVPTDSVVIVAQAVEHDDSSVDLINTAATAAAQNAFANALMNGVTDMWELGLVVQTALHDGVQSAALPLVDDDDVIGDAGIFMISQALFNGMQNNTSFTVDRLAAGNGATYRMRFSVSRLLP